MGATDNSFIKAYEQDPVSDSKHRASGISGVEVDETGITVSTPSVIALAERQQAVSHLYAAADRIRTRSKSISIKNAAAARAIPSNVPGVRIDGSDPVMPPAPHLPVETLADTTGDDGQPISDAQPISDGQPIDDATPTLPPSSQPAEPSSPTTNIPATSPAGVPAESLNVAVSTDSTALPTDSEIETETEEIATPAWRAQWEVDAVDWPELIEQMTELWAGELSALIRPLLTSAWQGENVIAVTSFNRGEGATTMALCLAKMAASFRVPVAIIDGDLVEPQVGERLGLAFGQSWNTLPTELPLTEAAISSAKDQMVILPGNTHFGLGNEANTAYLALDELSKNFELVILDAGPIFTAARSWFDGPAAEAIHGTLIIQDVRETTADQIDDVCARLGEVGMDQIAIVENFRNAA